MTKAKGPTTAHAAKTQGAQPPLCSTTGRISSALKVVGILQTLALVAFAANSIRVKMTAHTTPASPQPEVAEPVKEAPALAAHILTDATLPDFIAAQPDGVLLNFHSTGCSHCRALAPEFEAAAKELKEKEGAPLAFVDITAAPQAAERYGVYRYPTMLWFRGGEMVLELPPTVRKVDKITEYVEWASQPAVVTFDNRKELVESLPELRAVLAGNAPPLIAGFGNRPGLLEALEAAGERLRGKTLFVHSEENAGDAALQAFYADASQDQEFMGKLDQEAVLTWVKGLVAKSKAKRSL